MDHACFMGRLQRIRHLCHDFESHLQGHPPYLSEFPTPSCQILSGDIFLNQIIGGLIKEHVVQPDDVRMFANSFFQKTKERDLSLQGPDPFSLKTKLEDAPFFEPVVSSCPHLSETTFA